RHDCRPRPRLDKAPVRSNPFFDRYADNHEKRRMLKITPSGSTGEPFVFYADRHQLEIRWAATLRSVEWTGYRFGDRQARIWHQTIGMTPLQIVREKIDAWLCRRILVPAVERSGDKHRGCRARLRRDRAGPEGGAARRD